MNKKRTIHAAEEAFLKKILGFEYEEVKTTDEYDSDMNLLKRKTETIRKFVPPETGAVLSWLRENCPEKWAEKKNQTDEHYSGVIILPEVNDIE